MNKSPVRFSGGCGGGGASKQSHGFVQLTRQAVRSAERRVLYTTELMKRVACAALVRPIASFAFKRRLESNKPDASGSLRH